MKSPGYPTTPDQSGFFSSVLWVSFCNPVALRVGTVLLRLGLFFVRHAGG